MPRSARFVLSGHPFHLTHRGNNKRQIFYSDEDRRKYLFWFEEARQKWKVRVLSFCLMSNHVHFIAVPESDFSLAKMIHTVHRRYAYYLNQKYGHSGHLWEGRYYSCVLDDNHLMAAIRYVERNPVRANIVRKPWDWVWSSAREHLDLEKNIISLGDINRFFSIPRWREYIDQVESEEDLDQIRKQTMAFKAWANDDFRETVKQQYGIDLFLNERGRPKK